MTELEEAVTFANRVLDRINADPDDDLSVLARQFLRALDREKTASSGAVPSPATDEALAAAMEMIKSGLAALNAAYQLAIAEAQGLDKAADRLNRQIQEWRTTARAMISAGGAP